MRRRPKHDDYDFVDEDPEEREKLRRRFQRPHTIKRGYRERIKRSTSDNTASTNSTSKKKKKDTPLRRSNSASTHLGLTIVLKSDFSSYAYDYSATEHPYSHNDFIGFRVLVHSPYDFPEVSGKGFAVGSGNVAYIGIDASYTQSTQAVDKMSLSRRECIRHDDPVEDMEEEMNVKMEIFQNYSRPSCLMECRARHLDTHCGCLPYYYPNFGIAWKKEISCDLEGLICVAERKSELNALAVDDLEPEEITATEDQIKDFARGSTCNCPNNCEETTYRTELSQISLRDNSPIMEKVLSSDEYYGSEKKKVDKAYEEWQKNTTSRAKQKIYERLRDDYERQLNHFRDDAAVVHVYFQELGIIKYERDELYGIIDVIAAFGGIIGLCMGFSLLSLVELIYWFTLRMYNDKQKLDRARAKALG